jgi:hypothetical protein
MIINMTTIASRKTHYIHETLESLRQSDGRDIPINLILGSPDTSHIDRYGGTVNVVPWDQEAASQEGRPRHNCTLNAIRALKCGPDEHCLCCEDDVTFEKDWFSQLMLTVADIEGAEYVLHLAQRCNESPRQRYAIHARTNLSGAQAIFYPTKVMRNRVAEYLENRVKQRAGGTNDHLIGQYAKRHAALYNTIPVLVQHIGAVSSFH